MVEGLSNFIQQIGGDLLSLGALLVRIFVAFGIAWVVSRIARNRIEPVLATQRYGRDGALMMGRLISIGAYIFAFIAVVNQQGANWQGILTLLSAFTVAIGLALQDVLKNFFSGVFMLIERPFTVGDRVNVRTVTGTVRGVDIRTTLIHSKEGDLVLVPNSIMFGEILTNHSRGTADRMLFRVTAPQSEMATVRRTIDDILRECPSVETLPTASIVGSNAANGGTTLEYRVDLSDTQTPHSNILEAIIVALPEAIIEVLP